MRIVESVLTETKRFVEKTLSVGDFEELLIKEIGLVNYKFHCDLREIAGKKLIARPRFSSKGLIGKLKILENVENDKSSENKIIFEFDEKTHENSQGQHIVFYLDGKIVGGGEIKIFDKVVKMW